MNEHERLGSSPFADTSAFTGRPTPKLEHPPQVITPSPSEQFHKIAELLEDARAELLATPPRSGYSHDGLAAILDEAMELARKHA